MKFLINLYQDEFYKKTINVFSIKILSSIVGFLTTALLVKKLGGDGSSHYFFLISVVSFLTALSSFGSPDAILKYVAINREKGSLVKMLATKVCFLGLLFSLLLTILLFMVSFYYQVSDDEFFAISILITLPMSTLVLIIAAALQGKGKVVTAMLISGLFQNLLILSSLWLFAETYIEIILVFAFANFISSFIGYVLLVKGLNDNKGELDWLKFKETCSSMVVSQCIIQYNNNAGILLLGLLWAGTDLSIMAVSLKVTTLLGFIIISINKVMAPRIAETYRHCGSKELQSIITKSSRVMWLLCLPAIAFLFLFSQDVLGIIDKSYEENYEVLVILIIGQLVNVLTGNVGLLLSMTGYEKVQRNILAYSLVVTLVLGIFLVPVMGPLGAAITVSTNTVIVNLSSYFYVLKNLKVNTLKVL